MQASRIAHGASRLPLTTKRGNKDFYKGTRQAFVPGGGHRTGPPGKHVIGGKAKYRVLDEKVRYFVSPGAEVLNVSALKPYVATTNPSVPKERYHPSTNPYVPFAPNALHTTFDTTDPVTGRPVRIGANDTRAFGKWYAKLGVEERARMVGEQRREWYASLVARQERVAEEEARTRAVEEAR